MSSNLRLFCVLVCVGAAHAVAVAGFFPDLSPYDVESASLDLTGMGITHVPSGAFSRFTSLEAIFMPSNEITMIATDAFSGVAGNLLNLTLDYNSLGSSNLDFLTTLTALETLWMDSNGLPEMPPQIPSMTALVELSLNGNAFTAVPDGYFRNLGNMQLFQMVSNPISSLQADAFEGAVQLQFLYLLDFPITSVDGNAFRGLDSLIGLWFEKLPLLTSFPAGVLDPVRDTLQDFAITELPVSAIPAGLIGNMPQAWRVQIIDNPRLQDLPCDIFDNAPTIQLLSLRNNKFKWARECWFKNLGSLEILSFGGNPIVSLPKTLPSSLQQLYMYGLAVDNIPTSLFSSVPHLLYLAAFGNKNLKRIKSNLFESNSKMEALNLADCHLQGLQRNAFHGLTALQALYLSNNPIKQMHTQTFANLPSLEYLEMEGTKLTCEVYLPTPKKCSCSPNKRLRKQSGVLKCIKG